MNTHDFINASIRTEAPQDETKVAAEMMRQLHAAIGISTEAGELLDAFKKSLFYKRPLDKVNVLEEVGDLLWYIALLLDSMGHSFEDAFELVIKKLKTRYPEKFDVMMSDDRDLNAERELMEGLTNAEEKD